ncbi:glycosyl hydrolase family 28-related protein [Aphanizomenon flos-aquae]|jgi:hypothetical protein|uniref:Rhamnogalacturonase A/B/Epimerase-like pectate lyase domain-containing protein n=1 Tax=Aphanizomenon flos-aquae FACHB-1040 TaxID=2692887 RepID=A0ABR8BRM3_APHFL|nr:glycosyl hydrolase family 28-related protein [Aphanizomenon flos-aquae]MBD2277246.1 hypothetical protein [Aphanizomenon flos-aquae FACHB-1040]
MLIYQKLAKMFFRKFRFWLFWSLLSLLIIQSLHFSQSVTISKPQVYFLKSQSITSKNTSNANVSGNKLHTMQILDNDIKNIVSVKRFGAKGNGVNDDTKAIQTAIDTVYQQGGGVILFPEGVYIVTSVILKDNITYQGYGATIKRPDKQGKWTRTFTTNYSSQKNSQPLIIQGFTFDGNSQNQGHYKKYELEQAHLIFLTADPELPGKLQVFIEDCNFKNGVADGISVYTNVDVKINNCQAIDVFRGGFVLTGGNSSAEVYNLTTQGKIDPTGIDIEVDGRGYGETLKVDVKLENLNLIDGDFDIAVDEGSTVIGNNIISGNAPFYIFSLNSTMKFTNSQFKIGAADTYMNRILFPHNVTFENCQFTITRKLTGEQYDFFAGADIWWQHPSFSNQTNQRLVFDNCDFNIDKNIQKTDQVYAIYLREDQEVNNNRLIVRGGNISKDFLVPILRE